jgi:hypothetical protein
MVLKEGDKVLVAHRRLFARDESRFFLGRVDAYEAGIVKVTGHSYVRDMFTGDMHEKAELRTKLLSLSSGTLMVYLLPEPVILEDLRFVIDGRRLLLTDAKDFTMNLAEFVPRGQR